MHPPDFRELSRFILERKRRVPSEQFILGPHDLGQLRLGDHPIIVDGFEGQAARVSSGEAGQVPHEQVQRLVGGLDLAMAVLGSPFSGHFIDDGAQLIGCGQRQPEVSREVAQIFRHLKNRAHQHHGRMMQRIGQRDVFEETHMNVVLEVGLEIQQHEEALP